MERPGGWEVGMFLSGVAQLRTPRSSMSTPDTKLCINNTEPELSQQEGSTSERVQNGTIASASAQVAVQALL
ncbi:MAG: hypothetical protein FRX49_12873 [Trebouxia sp. A1-2]|nr:MAG: hypothetical protein FRX49_12873 [Trebouxia sp. A1-2]